MNPQPQSPETGLRVIAYSVDDLQTAEEGFRVMRRRAEDLKAELEYLHRELKHTRELLNVAIQSKRVAMALSD